MRSNTPPPTSPLKAPKGVTFGAAIQTLKFWALMLCALSFFIYGGELNLHLPAIMEREAGRTAVEAASIYAIYNGCAICGKLLVGVVFSSRPMKRSYIVYLPSPLIFALSHFVLVDVISPARLMRGEVLAALAITTRVYRLRLFCAMVGVSYGFVASLLHLLVREFFGLVDLCRLQPIIFGAMIVGEMVGMAVPGILYDQYGTYCASLVVSFGSSLLTMATFLVMYCQHPLEAPPRSSASPPRTGKSHHDAAKSSAARELV